MNAIKQQLFSGWNLLRWIRLIIGIALAVEAFSGGNAIIGIAAGILFFQAFTNTGCGGGNCDVPGAKTSARKDE